MSDDPMDQQRVAAAAAPAQGDAPAGGPAPGDRGAEDGALDSGPGAVVLLLAATVMAPWLLVYGATGAWAVTRGARAAAQGLEQLDAGYTRLVAPVELMYVGALLLAAFATLLACGLLLLFRRRSAMVWLPVLLVAAGLTAGSLWAAVSGGLHPLLWVLFFFGLVYATVIALIRTVQVTRAGRRARIVSP